MASRNDLWASTHLLQLARMAGCKTDFLCTLLDGLNTEVNVDELNSKNAVFRVGISPKSKELTCILCVESL